MKVTTRVLLAAAFVVAVSAQQRKTKPPFVVDAVGNTLPPPSSGPATVGSPVNLISPDRYEFYTFDESGELVKRLMTLEEIQTIVAAGDEADGLVTFANENQPTVTFNFSQPPYNKVHSVVENVQNVLKAQMEAHKNKPYVKPTLDTPDVSDSWSLILPSIFGNTGGVDIVPDKNPITFTTPETETFDVETLNTNFLSKEGSNQLFSSTTTERPELKVNLVSEVQTTTKEASTSSKPTTTSTTTTKTTTTTTTPKPTTTTQKPTTTTTTTKKPTTTTTTEKPTTTTTTEKPTTTTTTTVKPTTTTTTTEKPTTTEKATTTEKTRTTTFKAKTTARPATTTQKPKTTTTTLAPTTARATTITAKTTYGSTTKVPVSSSSTKKYVALSSSTKTPYTTLSESHTKGTTTSWSRPKPSSTSFQPRPTTTTTQTRLSTTTKPRITTVSTTQTFKTTPTVTTLQSESEFTLQSASSLKPSDDEHNKNTVMYDRISTFLPVSTVSYVTQRLTEKTTEKPKTPTTSVFVSSTKFSTTKSSISTTTTTPFTNEPKITTFRPILPTTNFLSTSTINNKVEEEEKINTTTITTQSISPSSSIPSTSETYTFYTDDRNEPIPPLPPMFDVALSISQIASDLGNNNYQPIPTTSDLLDTTKLSIGLESKENFELDITDTNHHNKTSSVNKLSEEKTDNYVKISTIDPHNSTKDKVSGASEVPAESQVKYSTSTTVSELEMEKQTDIPQKTTIDPILSGSMDDLLSQVVNQAAQTMIEKKKDDNKKEPVLSNDDIKVGNIVTKTYQLETSTTPVNKDFSETEKIKTTTNEYNEKLKTTSSSTESNKVFETKLPSEILFTENSENIISTAEYPKTTEKYILIALSTPESNDIITGSPQISTTEKEEANSSITLSTLETTEKTEPSTIESNDISTNKPQTSFVRWDAIKDKPDSINKEEQASKTQLDNFNKVKQVSKEKPGEFDKTEQATQDQPINLSKLEQVQKEIPVNVNNLELVKSEKPEDLKKKGQQIEETSEIVNKTDQPVENPASVNKNMQDSEKKPENIKVEQAPSEKKENSNLKENDLKIKPDVNKEYQGHLEKHEDVNKTEQASKDKVETLNKLEQVSKLNVESINKPEQAPNENLQSFNKVESATEGNSENLFKVEVTPKEEQKKKIQKVNIDDKELANEQNSSWKLISTVSPPKSNEIPKDKLKADTKNNDNKNMLLDFSHENQGLEVTTKDLSEDIAQFTDLCNELAFRYWNAMIQNFDKKRSFVLSPFSITSMLAMMFMGARGSTSGEMNEILKLDDMVTFNPHFTLKNISDSIETSPESGVVVSAFIRELYSDKGKGKVLTFYKERAQHFYNGHVEEINFKLISDIIRRRTNLLVKRYTWGKMVEYMKYNDIVMQPPLAAFSANIFLTDCTKSSVDGRDGEMYFVVSPSVRQRRLVPVPAVVYRSDFLAGYDPVLDATAAALGDTHSTVTTMFLMPGQQGNVVHAEDLEALEKRLLNTNPTTPTFNRILRTLLPRIGLELQIPRFSHKSIFNISSTLKKMGLKDLFDSDHADLGGLIGPSKDLYLSDMVQQTTFVTCGEGVIADQHHIEDYPDNLELAKRRRTSRWTGDWDEPRDYQRAFHDPHDLGEAMNLPLHLRPRQARLPARNAQPARLKFDRPFLYFVRHNPTGMILYVGRYNPRLLP